jgi:hypothetical protein
VADRAPREDRHARPQKWKRRHPGPRGYNRDIVSATSATQLEPISHLDFIRVQERLLARCDRLCVQVTSMPWDLPERVGSTARIADWMGVRSYGGAGKSRAQPAGRLDPVGSSSHHTARHGGSSTNRRGVPWAGSGARPSRDVPVSRCSRRARANTMGTGRARRSRAARITHRSRILHPRSPRPERNGGRLQGAPARPPSTRSEGRPSLSGTDAG